MGEKEINKNYPQSFYSNALSSSVRCKNGINQCFYKPENKSGLEDRTKENYPQSYYQTKIK